MGKGLKKLLRILDKNNWRPEESLIFSLKHKLRQNISISLISVFWEQTFSEILDEFNPNIKGIVFWALILNSILQYKHWWKKSLNFKIRIHCQSFHFFHYCIKFSDENFNEPSWITARRVFSECVYELLDKFWSIDQSFYVKTQKSH